MPDTACRLTQVQGLPIKASGLLPEARATAGIEQETVQENAKRFCSHIVLHAGADAVAACSGQCADLSSSYSASRGTVMRAWPM